jgi:hypothetical protein
LERSSDVEFCGVGRLRISLSDMRPVRWALAGKEPFTPLLRNEDTDIRVHKQQDAVTLV